MTINPFRDPAAPYGEWIQTYSGATFDFENPETSPMLPIDIAHALALQNRFNGHTREPYSVAEHLVRSSYAVEPGHELAALLHDAPEFVTGDLVSPLKRLLPDFKTHEKRIERSLFRRFGVPEELSPEVKRVDLVMLATEKRDLMPDHGDTWECLIGVEPLPDRIRPWEWRTAELSWLARFSELTGTMPEYAPSKYRRDGFGKVLPNAYR
jgi:hypothetical protein